MSDVLIIGHGPAGISSALYALRGKMSVTLVGFDSGSLSKAHLIENYYGLEKPVSGIELAEIGKRQAENLGAKLIDDELTDLFYDGNEFVATGLCGEYRGRACIMATGAARKRLPLKGIAELEGHGVSYCAVCDAFFYRGKNVCVLGAGEYALHEVNELLPVVGSVTLLTNGIRPTVSFPEKVNVDERVIASLEGNATFEGVHFEDGNKACFDGMFIALGSASAMDLARKAGAAFCNGNVVLDKDFMTTVPGLFCAGDCTGGTLQVAVAVGEGAIAGLAALKFLRQQKA